LTLLNGQQPLELPIVLLIARHMKRTLQTIAPRRRISAIYPRSRTVPITRMLTDSNFTPEQRHVLELAFNYALRKLHLVDRNDPVCEMVARKVIEIGATGVTNAVAISEIAFRQLVPKASDDLPVV
jgi:hypothetical protein